MAAVHAIFLAIFLGLSAYIHTKPSQLPSKGTNTTDHCQSRKGKSMGMTLTLLLFNLG